MIFKHICGSSFVSISASTARNCTQQTFQVIKSLLERLEHDLKVVPGCDQLFRTNVPGLT